MFDIAPSEFLLVAFVALVVIGPKDLPKAMRVLGYWVGRARAVGRQFRSGFDEMVREAELEEMEKKWKAENERIMREHPFIPSPPPASAADAPAALVDHRDGPDTTGDLPAPVMVEKPQVVGAGTVPDAPPAPDAPAHPPAAPAPDRTVS
ncbi:MULTISPECIES: Sec-independent protein translocase protein TatB [Sphingomonas]|jgi:sec-independent protein translocase protein TatB|uniref:Sec-independent protein translocase protein TatB n=2 Tax=Sphingomonadaceae TaxID=41297 RepID=UPI00083187AB|nr:MULTISPECIES: Sec-independent protein translocase protein TatB [Sphingomonas]MEE2916488.1 Sec-independent protein translocase protein TatB [Pseudomonadota bacterium]